MAEIFFIYFRASTAEDMDVEVTQILKKWNLSNPVPRQQIEIRDVPSQQEVFDSRTFTRSKRRFNASDPASRTAKEAQSDSPFTESGVRD